MMFLATELEGHPDNVAAAIHGGATIAWMENLYGVPTGRAVSIPVHPDIKAIMFIPETQLATAKARKLLPETVPHHDAVLNSSHAALLSIALSSRPDLLLTAWCSCNKNSYLPCSRRASRCDPVGDLMLLREGQFPLAFPI